MLKRSIILTGALALMSLVAEYGLGWPGGVLRTALDALFIAAFAGWVMWRALLDRRPAALWPVLIVVAVLVLRPLVEARYGEADPPTAKRLLDALRVSIVARVYLMIAGGVEVWRSVGPKGCRILVTHPIRSTVAVYAVMIAAGVVLLSLPGVYTPGLHVPFTDTFFMTISAATLTGLSSISVAAEMTRFGQLLLALLVQTAAIAIMVLGAAYWLHVRRGVKNSTPDEAAASLQVVIRVILIAVVLVEAAGTLLLFRLLPHGEFSTFTRVFVAGFHAISAFCNAGFSVYTRGMAPFYADWDITLVISGLSFAGGLGFFVYLAAAGRFRRDLPGFKVLAAVITVSSLVLVALGMMAILGYGHGPLSMSGLHALFHSVSARSSGFELAPVGSLGVGAGFILAVLMMIGGAPGSAAGGIKITTAVVLGAAILSPRHRRWEPELQAALAVLVTSAFAVCLGGVLLWLLESEMATVRALFFQAVSAFGTVGFSQSHVARFSVPGKLVLITMMMLGRVMPMVVGLLIYRRASRPPDGTLMIG